MIKVTENKKEVKQAEVKYPCLMVDNDNKLIVLFYANGRGVVIVGNDVHESGYHSEIWAENYFTPIDYPITLENVK